jgi:hypothetical protein
VSKLLLTIVNPRQRQNGKGKNGKTEGIQRRSSQVPAMLLGMGALPFFLCHWFMALYPFPAQRDLSFAVFPFAVLPLPMEVP